MERRDKLLHGIDVSTRAGLEIGALCRPFLKREDGDVTYVDHADTATLREKYRNDPDVQLNKLVDVDAVWGANTLVEAIGRKVDYVVASHVVEHVPDLIGWLQELQSVLNDGGEVRLVVPDKRFTFDYLRHETHLAEVVYATLLKTRTPLAHLVLDYVVNVVKLDGGKAWRGEVDETTLERHHTIEQAKQCALGALRDGVYHDIHCWVFTPRSFGLLFADLAARGLMSFECTSFFDTAPYTNEFFVGLRPTTDAVRAEQSWREMAMSAQYIETSLATAQAPDPTAVELSEKLAHAEHTVKEIQRALADAERARDFAERERVESRRQLSAILASRTWKMTSRLVRANRSIRKLTGLSKT